MLAFTTDDDANEDGVDDININNSGEGGRVSGVDRGGCGSDGYGGGYGYGGNGPGMTDLSAVSAGSIDDTVVDVEAIGSGFSDSIAANLSLGRRRVNFDLEDDEGDKRGPPEDSGVKGMGTNPPEPQESDLTEEPSYMHLQRSLSFKDAMSRFNK
jgi:hypothetical protein